MVLDSFKNVPQENALWKERNHFIMVPQNSPKTMEEMLAKNNLQETQAEKKGIVVEK